MAPNMLQEMNDPVAQPEYVLPSFQDFNNTHI